VGDESLLLPHAPRIAAMVERTTMEVRKRAPLARRAGGHPSEEFAKRKRERALREK
jgi:hypothetical protein